MLPVTFSRPAPSCLQLESTVIYPARSGCSYVRDFPRSTILLRNCTSRIFPRSSPGQCYETVASVADVFNRPPSHITNSPRHTFHKTVVCYYCGISSHIPRFCRKQQYESCPYGQHYLSYASPFNRYQYYPPVSDHITIPYFVTCFTLGIMTTAAGTHQGILVAELHCHIPIYPQAIVPPHVSALPHVRKTDKHGSERSDCEYGYDKGSSSIAPSKPDYGRNRWFNLSCTGGHQFIYPCIVNAYARFFCTSRSRAEVRL